MHGLDSQIFPDAEAVDPRRKSQVTSTFGQGPHRCPGAMLARAEVRTVLREWLRRIPDFKTELIIRWRSNCAGCSALQLLGLACAVGARFVARGAR
jgi:cytochrome P450